MIQLKSDNTWGQLYSFELISFGRQMATFANNSVANFFFHSPWRPKWSQLGALYNRQLSSAFQSLYGGQFTLSTPLIKPNYLVILPPMQHSQHHSSFFRNLPPLFQVCQLPFPIRQKLRLQLLKYSPSPAGISSWKRNIHWGLCIACCDSLAWNPHLCSSQDTAAKFAQGWDFLQHWEP